MDSHFFLCVSQNAWLLLVCFAVAAFVTWLVRLLAITSTILSRFMPDSSGTWLADVQGAFRVQITTLNLFFIDKVSNQNDAERWPQRWGDTQIARVFGGAMSDWSVQTLCSDENIGGDDPDSTRTPTTTPQPQSEETVATDDLLVETGAFCNSDQCSAYEPQPDDIDL